ncbi:hypothetical protein BGZ96_003217 [Linnemannia gamsii]|uniref:Galactose oxidase n=1 Tax=Linnemannia gamsii TaxID=64522 RepID=A0ABQ7K7Z3_9FUNG|nr:hypothetical protein BGZ96_003217 [Linnemannia gamsii]
MARAPQCRRHCVSHFQWAFNGGIEGSSGTLYLGPIPVTRMVDSGIRSGVDMISGNIFIPGASDNGTQMVMNAPGNSSVPRTLMPTDLFPVPIVQESFVWSTYRSSFLHYGAYDGRKMIVFGGAGLDEVANADIHILDMPTREWTRGKSADATHARRNMACATSGDSFLAWGGESALQNKNGTPIVYDIRNDQWTSLFRRNTTLPLPTEPSTPSNTVTPPSSPDTATNIAAVGGGVAGATT